MMEKLMDKNWFSQHQIGLSWIVLALSLCLVFITVSWAFLRQRAQDEKIYEERIARSAQVNDYLRFVCELNEAKTEAMVRFVQDSMRPGMTAEEVRIRNMRLERFHDDLDAIDHACVARIPPPVVDTR